MDATGATACFVAAQNGANETLAVLIAAGADIERARTSGATPVYIAAQQGTLPCLSTLLDAKANPSTCKEGGFAPLSIACLRGRGECVELLLGARAAVDYAYTIADRFTPLMLAAHLGSTSMIEMLIRHGASLRKRDASRRTPREIALSEGHGLAASLLASKEGEEAREGQAMAEEATLQEFKQMTPVREELEISRESLDAIGMQLATFGSQQTIFSAASQLCHSR